MSRANESESLNARAVAAAYAPPAYEGAFHNPSALPPLSQRALLVNAATLAAGLLTSAATVGLVLLIEKVFDVDLFSWMVHRILPGGAIVVGLAAASGYRFGATRFHARPTLALSLGVLGLTACLQFVLYVAHYLMARNGEGVPTGVVVDFITFTAYSLSHQVYTSGHSLDSETELGNLGYGVALLQFVGLLLGATLAFWGLRARPYCGTCARYATPAGTRGFMTSVSGKEIIAVLRGLKPLSPEYWKALDDRDFGGWHGLDVVLSKCPVCQRRAVWEIPKTLHKSRWRRHTIFSRVVWLDEAMDLSTPTHESHPHGLRR